MVGPADDETAARLMKVASGHVCDALEHLGIQTPCLSNRFRPVTQRCAFAGPAATLQLALSRTGSEARRLNAAVEDGVGPGAVVVIDALGRTDWAVFGDRAALAARQHGAVAAVIDGATRDVEGLDELGFVVHAVGIALPASEGRYQGLAINGDVTLDGVLVRAGDWLVGDRSGVCVIPAELLAEVTELAEERETIDAESLDGLRAGKKLSEVHRHFKDDDVQRLRATE